MSIPRGSAAALLTLVVLAPGVPQAACPGVDHANYAASNWEYDAFTEAGTVNPLTVTLTISQISRTTTVEYFDGASWIEVSGGAVVEGTKTRFTQGGSVTIRYDYLDCGEEIQTSDT